MHYSVKHYCRNYEYSGTVNLYTYRLDCIYTLLFSFLSNVKAKNVISVNSCQVRRKYNIRKPLKLYTSSVMLQENSLLFFHPFSFCFLQSLQRHLASSGPDPCRVEQGELPSRSTKVSNTTELFCNGNIARIQTGSSKRDVMMFLSLKHWKQMKSEQRYSLFAKCKMKQLFLSPA